MTRNLEDVYGDVTMDAWVQDDPGPVTRAESTELLSIARSYGEQTRTARRVFSNAFSDTFTFDTIGLQNHSGGGPNRMNRAVVIRVAAGLSAYLKDRLGEGFSVVIGYGARHDFGQFTLNAAATVIGVGGRAILFKSHCPTPVLIFTLRHLGTDTSVVVTTLYDLPQDNGYEIHLDGRVMTDSSQEAQIIPPYNSQIAAAIDAIGPVSSVPRPQSNWETVAPEIRGGYIERATQAVQMTAPTPMRIVLAAMHGVGGTTCRGVLARAGFTNAVEVVKQFEPDSDFPTTAFPNPEESGALDLALDRARKIEADLVIADDSDADRCSAAILGEDAPGDWRQLTGDEAGALLGKQAAELVAPAGDEILACPVIFSRLLRWIAQSHSLSFRRTLTGFRWIDQEPGLVSDYEEALGYCVDSAVVQDKDSTSASVRLVMLISVLEQQGRALQDLLNRLARDHDLHATSPLSMRVEDLEAIINIMERLRSGGASAKLVGSPVTTIVDLPNGISDGDGDALPPTDSLMWVTASDGRMAMRPPGAEPKLKYYCEVILLMSDTPMAQMRGTAAERLETIRVDLRGTLGVAARVGLIRLRTLLQHRRERPRRIGGLSPSVTAVPAPGHRTS